MTSTRRISIALGLVTALVLMDAGLRLRQWRFNQETRAFAKLFRVVSVSTNGTDGVMIVDRRTLEPVWGSWDFGGGGKPDTVSYFFEGRNIMNIYPKRGDPPHIDVAFFGEDGRMRAVWANRGTNDGFTERTLFSDGAPRKEVWFGDSWHTMEYRTNGAAIRGGISVDGEWRHVVFTNGALALEP
jgi:hypothetical protein